MKLSLFGVFLASVAGILCYIFGYNIGKEEGLKLQVSPEFKAEQELIRKMKQELAEVKPGDLIYEKDGKTVMLVTGNNGEMILSRHHNFMKQDNPMRIEILASEVSRIVRRSDPNWCFTIDTYLGIKPEKK